MKSKIKSNKSKILMLLAVVTVTLNLAGCNGFGVGRTVQGEPEGEFLRGAVVKGFPRVPSYPDAKIDETYGDGTSYGATSVTGDKLDKVLAYFVKNLPSEGWEANTSQVNARHYVINIKNQQYLGQIIINTTADSKKIAVTVYVTKRSES